MCSRSNIAGVITTAALEIVVVSGGVHLRLIIPGTSCGDTAEEEANVSDNLSCLLEGIATTTANQSICKYPKEPMRTLE